MEKRIMVFVHRGKGYIWSADEAAYLGQELNIIGLAVGGISEFRGQNYALGLPIQLSLENILPALLKGWAKTVRIDFERLSRLNHFMLNGSNITANRSTNPNNYSFDLQLAYKSRDYLKSNDGHSNYDIFGKKNKVISSIYRMASTPNIFEKITTTFSKKSFTRAYDVKRQISIKLTPPISPAIIYNVAWPLSLSAEQRARCAVVFDLQRSGYFITDGIKFGGDLLIYPGNPVLFHAQFVLRIVNVNSFLVPHLLISQARTSHTTRKKLLLAVADEKTLLHLRKGSRILVDYSNGHEINKFKRQKHISNHTAKTIVIGNHGVTINYFTISPHLIL